MSIEKKKQILSGVVVSTRMPKTVVVLIKNKRKQPLYGKYIVTTQKISAHVDNNETYKQGDKVVIMPCRPISKNKSWIVVNDSNLILN